MGTQRIEILEEPRSDTISLVADTTIPIRYVAEEPVVEIASRDLRDDMKRVTGRQPPCRRGFDDLGARAILIGTYGTDERFDRGIDRIAPDHELDDRSESFFLGVVGEADVDAPLDADEALVVAGSDPRGTVYGVYELSKRIGVSPWY